MGKTTGRQAWGIARLLETCRALPHIRAAALVGVLAAAATSGLAAAEPESVIIEGELVDVVCHVAQRSADAAHADACQASRGVNPIGVLAGTGDQALLWVLASPPSFLAEHLGQRARVTGERSPLGPLVKPSRVEIAGEDGNWTEVPVMPEI